MEKAREAYDQLKAAGIPVPSWPDVDSIESVRRLESWLYVNTRYYVYSRGEYLRQPMLIIFNWCAGRLGELKKERSERISKDRERYASKGNPFQRR